MGESDALPGERRRSPECARAGVVAEEINCMIPSASYCVLHRHKGAREQVSPACPLRAHVPITTGGRDWGERRRRERGGGLTLADDSTVR